MLAFFFLSIPPAAWIVAALNDIRALRIPNWISITLAAIFPIAGLVIGLPLATIGSSMLLGLIILFLGMGLFALRVLGGGDAKLLAASAPWIGLTTIWIFVFKVALVGGLVAVALMVFRKSPLLPVYAQAPWILKLHQSGKQIPYGIAIAAGGLWALPDTQIFLTVFGT